MVVLGLCFVGVVGYEGLFGLDWSVEFVVVVDVYLWIFVELYEKFEYLDGVWLVFSVGGSFFFDWVVVVFVLFGEDVDVVLCFGVF